MLFRPARWRSTARAPRPAPHTFDMKLPDRTVLGMKLGYDATAEADARRQVTDFLTAHGMVR